MSVPDIAQDNTISYVRYRTLRRDVLCQYRTSRKTIGSWYLLCSPHYIQPYEVAGLVPAQPMSVPDIAEDKREEGDATRCSASASGSTIRYVSTGHRVARAKADFAVHHVSTGHLRAQSIASQAAGPTWRVIDIDHVEFVVVCLLHARGLRTVCDRFTARGRGETHPWPPSPTAVQSLTLVRTSRMRCLRPRASYLLQRRRVCCSSSPQHDAEHRSPIPLGQILALVRGCLNRSSYVGLS
eukprot:3040998-Rhodomonas_salina.2